MPEALPPQTEVERKKRPAFQFYPADWRKDAALQSCSLAAQGLWMNLLCVMHECEPYGHLTINGQPMASAQIGRLVGLSAKDCDRLVAELRDALVCDYTSAGVLFSRRMVRDEKLRNTRAESGRLGGNPVLLGVKVKQTDNHSDKQSPTPSSSSSSSPSGEEKTLLTQGGDRPSADPPALALVEPPKASPPSCPHLDILALWSEVLPAMPQHKPELWRGSRADHLRARWRETAVAKGWPDQAAGIAYFRRLFAYVGQSAFLTGRAKASDPSRPPFVIELAWLVEPTNWAKVIEGKFHPEAA